MSQLDALPYESSLRHLNHRSYATFHPERHTLRGGLTPTGRLLMPSLVCVSTEDGQLATFPTEIAGLPTLTTFRHEKLYIGIHPLCQP